jgi:hypothetical protein
MTLQAHGLPLALDPLIAEAKRRARQRRSLLIVAAIMVVAAGSVGLVKFAASPTPVAGRAAVVRVVELPHWGAPLVIAAPSLGNVDITGTFVQLRGIEKLIPKTLPKNPLQTCRTGPTVTIWLRDGGVLHYGPCERPASIEHLRLALVRYARKH